MENQIKTTINHHNSYGVFCMANIISVNNRELDLIWEEAIKTYNLFESSAFNVDTMSELDCMESFYRSYQKRADMYKNSTYLMNNNTTVKSEVISAIERLSKIEIDGETMEFILQHLGMEEQMLSQLGGKLQAENENLKHRLAIISEEENSLRRFIKDNATELFNVPTSLNDGAITYLNNIEIACDLASDESSNWKLQSK